MTPFAFASRTKNVIAFALSALAILTLAAYATAPVAAKPSIAVMATPSRHPAVIGLVKGQGRARARVRLVFDDRSGRVLAVQRPRVGRRGAWRQRIPRRAATVVVIVRVGHRSVRALLDLPRGRSLHVTAMFPGRRSGLLPALLPY